jgi:hypothetical protein
MQPNASPNAAPEVKTATEAHSAPVPTARKFVLQADTEEDLCIEFAKTMLQQGRFITKENKSGNGSKYAIWSLDDGLSTNPYSQGLGLTEEQARRLPTKDGVPAILSVDLIMRQLTPIVGVKTKLAERQAATANRESRLLTELNAIRRKNGLPEVA